MSSSLDKIFASVDQTNNISKKLKGPLFNRDITPSPNKEHEIQRFCFRQGVRMILLIGPPIQAKEDLIARLATKEKEMRCFAADDFFMKDGKYVFDARGLLRAHQRCQGNVRDALMKKCPLVVVNNTSVKRDHIKVYDDFKYPFAVVVFQPSSPADAIALGIGNPKNLPQYVFENCYNEMQHLSLNDEEFPMLKGVFRMQV